MRILAVALALNSVGVYSQKEYDRLKSKHVSLGHKHDKIESYFEKYKYKYEV